MDHKSFILYQTSEELIGMLSDEDCGKLMRALFVYARTKETPKLPDMVKLVFTTMRQYIDENDKKWESQREKRSQAGKISAQVRRAAAEKRAEQVPLPGDALDEDLDDDPDIGDRMGTCVDFVEQDETASTVSVSAPVSEFVSVSVSAPASAPVSESVSVSVSAPASVPASEFGSARDFEQGADPDPIVPAQVCREKERTEPMEPTEQLEQERVQKRKQEILAFCEQSGSRPRADGTGEKHPVFFEHNSEHMNRASIGNTDFNANPAWNNRTEEPTTYKPQSDCSSDGDCGTLYEIPSYEDVVAYCQKYRLYTDPKRFYRINQESGWMCGGKPMRDWRAVLRGWSKKDQSLRQSVEQERGGHYAYGTASERPMTPEEIEHEKMIDEWVQLAMNRPFDEVD